jgi:alpha-1,2-mannosyltransferase
MQDLGVYRAGGSAVLHRRGIYLATSGALHLHFTYPPFAAAVFAPLAALSAGAARTTFAVLGVGCLALSLYVLTRRLGAPWPPGATALLLAAALWLEPVRSTLSFGQVNLLLMALVLLDSLVLRRSRFGGVLTGVAAAMKLTPLAFLVLFALTGRRRAAATGIATFVGCALAGAAVAPRSSSAYWLGARFLSPHRVGRVENASNQSIRGVLARLLHTVTVPGWWVALAAVVFAVGLAVAVRVHRAGEPEWAVLITAIAGLLASPVSWSHHWVWSAATLVVCVDLARRKPRPWMLLLGCALMAPYAVGLVFFAPHSGHLELADTWWQQLLSASYVIAGIATVAVLAVASRRRGPEPPEPRSRPAALAMAG